MSTFAVFGMSRSRSKFLATRDIERQTLKSGSMLSEAEFLVRVNELAETIYDSTLSTMLSDKFDAPQFANEFKRICKRTDGGKNLQVMTYAKTGEVSEKTGRPKRSWRVYIA